MEEERLRYDPDAKVGLTSKEIEERVKRPFLIIYLIYFY